MKLLTRVVSVLALLACAQAQAWVVTGNSNFNPNSISNTVTTTCALTCEVGFYEQFNAGTGATIASAVCSSTGGGSPTAATSIPPATTSSAETGLQYYCLNQTAGTISVVVTYTVSCQNALLVLAGSGGNHSIDGTGGTHDSNFQGTAANAVQGQSVTTTANGDLIMSFGNWVSVSTTLSSGTGFTQVSACNLSSACQYIVQSSAGAITPTMTSSNAADIITGTVAFKPASGGGGGSTSGMLLTFP